MGGVRSGGKGAIVLYSTLLSTAGISKDSGGVVSFDLDFVDTPAK